jgi:phosphoglucosamine mutase
MELFGTDGVRGKAGKMLSSSVAMRLAMAAGVYFRKNSITNKILVGKDTRKSGYMIENAIVSGLTAVGFDVIQIGPMPTPAVAFLTENMRCDAGIMISASHNPFGDNGIKFFDKNGDKLNEEMEADIEAIYQDDVQIENAQQVDNKIGYSKRIDDVIGRYIVHIKNSFPKHLTLHGMRIVLDVANGAAYKVAPTIFSELGAEVIVLNDEPNGLNINEDCGALHPASLQKNVKKLRADLGFAFDGDADRVVVVDDRAHVVDGDKLIGALANFLHENGKLAKNGVCATVMSNKALEDYLGVKGISLYRSNVGDKYVLEVMKEKSLSLGGEQSGHIIFGDYAKTGDGLVSALQVAASVILSGKKASEVLNVFEPYPQILTNLNITQKIPLEDIEGYSTLEKEVSDLGIRVLIRYSGTENKIRILLEGKDERLIQKHSQRFATLLKQKLND